MKILRPSWLWLLAMALGCAGVRTPPPPPPVTPDVTAAVTAASELAERRQAAVADAEKVQAEIALGESLERADLPVAALIHYAFAVNGAKGYDSIPAVERLVALQESLEDTLLVPNLLGVGIRPEWSKLRPEELARVQYLAAEVNLRRGKFEEARALLRGISFDVQVYPAARYLLGVVLADPRFPGGPKGEEAVKAFQEAVDASGAPVRGSKDAVLEPRERVRQLALLGRGRVHYALKQYAESSRAYEQVPRFSPFWDQALFENAFARFQNDDLGGSLGSLQALHAPQYEGAFQPESWILKSTVYYFSCLYREATESLNAYDRIYQPMVESLKRYLEDRSHTPEELFSWISADSTHQAPSALPKPVLLWVRDSERIRALAKLLRALDRDEARIRSTSAWTGPTADRLLGELLENRKSISRVAGQLSRNRLEEALRVLRNLNDQALVIRFETLKAEKEIIESGVDHDTFLQRQPLYRPQLPEEDWDYWRFQGEFWIDEMGYYQYTLKRGCPAGGQQSDASSAPAP